MAEPTVIPKDKTELVSIKPSRKGLWLPLLVFVLIALVPLARFVDAYNYVLQVGIGLLMWVTLTTSWNILGGYTGYISLGHNVFFGVGGYTAALLFTHFGISPFIGSILAGMVALVLGILAGFITLRTRGPAFIISTIALLLVITLWFDNWEFVGGVNGMSLPLIPLPLEFVKVPFYYAMLIAAVGSIWLGYRIAHSKLGLALRAIAQDEVKAEVAGINTRRLKITAFALSAFFPGVVGAIWGYNLAYLRPLIFFTIAVAAQMVLMAIIGGRGTVAGPVVGAFLIVGLNEISISQFGGSELNLVITGLILVIVLLFFPLGIIGSLREAGKLPAALDWD